jgi:2-aminoethylphosphonate-pyruvate transaminase
MGRVGRAGGNFRAYAPVDDQSYIITTYRYPDRPDFSFEAFYGQLSESGFPIYPGKLSQEPCFRIGTIGQLCETDIDRLLEAIGRVAGERFGAAPPAGC